MSAPAFSSVMKREKFAQCKGFLFDLDGTLVLGNKLNHGLQPIPGAVEFLQRLDADDFPYVIFTNGSLRSPTDYEKSLQALDFPIPAGRAMTPINGAIATFTAKKYKNLLVLGGDGMLIPLRASGFNAVHIRDLVDKKVTVTTQFDAVLAGWYRDFTMDDLTLACAAVEAGAKPYSCSDALHFATAGGKALGSSRIISTVIREVTGVDAEVVGKPSLIGLQCAADILGIAPHELAVVGDDPELEIVMTLQGGAFGIAVCTGLANRETYETLPTTQQPDMLVDSIRDVMAQYLSVFTE